MDYIILVAVWIVCGVISYGLDFVYFQGKHSAIAQQLYTEDKIKCAFYVLFGPLNLITIIIHNDYSYGFKFK